MSVHFGPLNGWTVDGLGSVSQDLADRGVVEERVRGRGDRRDRQGLDLAGKRALGLEGLDLLLGGSEPGSDLLCGVDVVALRRDGQVGTSPVAATAGEDVGNVPAGDALGGCPR